MSTKKQYNAIGKLTIEEISPGLLQDIKDIAVDVAGIEEANTTSFDASKYEEGHIMHEVDDVQEAIDKLTDLVDNTATSSEDGLMSRSDKAKLDGIEKGANNYVHPFSHDASIIVESSAKRFVSDAEKASWNSKAPGTMASASANGLMSSADKAKLDTVSQNANYYVHPTADGYKHVPANGTTNNGKFLQATATAGTYQWASLPTASTSAAGLVQLSDSINSTSTTTAATSSAVKVAYDRANHSHPYAPTTHTHSEYATKSDISSLGTGDMSKSVYDTNGNGIVDKAESVSWSGVTDKPSSFTPSAHTHDDRYYTETEINTLLTGKANSSHGNHIPSGGSAGQILRWSADGTAAWGADNNTTYGVVSKTANGLAPMLPNETGTTKYLRQDGTWAVPPNTNTTYAVATTTSNGLMSSTDKSKLDGIATGANKTVLNNTVTSTSTTEAATANAVKTAYDKANHSHPYAASTHTHNYAGSSSAGGAATSALTCTGNSATATTLQTARTINGTSFNGSANITTANWGTARTITIGNTGKSVNGSGNVSWSLSEIGAAATSHTHTKSQITDFPSSLPANGGNSDTVDGRHADGFFKYTQYPGGANLNSAFETGVHWIYNATGTLPAGYAAGDNDFMLQVCRSGLTNTSWQIQILYDMRSTRMFARRQRGGSFDPWIEMYTMAGGHASGTISTAGDLITTAANGFRMVQGNYGFFLRQDGGNLWFMLTNSGDQYGGYNSKRPMRIELPTGDVYFGQYVNFGLNIDIGNSNGNVRRTAISPNGPSGWGHCDLWVQY